MKARIALLRRWKGRHGAIEAVLVKAGYDVVRYEDSGFKPDVDVVWAQGNVNWFPRVRSVLSSMDKRKRPALMVWHSEPLPFPRNSGFPQPRLTLREVAKIVLRDKRATDAYTNYFRLRQMNRSGVLDLCIASSRSRQQLLLERGIPAEFVPLGYHASLGHDLGIERDIDVLFLGTSDDSRHRDALRFLRAKGIDVEARGSWSGRETWGESRTRLINRAKIFLNVQRHPGQYSGLRMLLGMANRALVVSEPVHDPFPYEPGVHYVSSPLEEMPVIISKYLADLPSRQAIVENGHRLVTTTLTTENSVQQIISLMERMLSARDAS